jgi:hypothetical protein
METEIEEQRDKIIEQLELLNEQMSQQNTTRHFFFKGIIYGFGFFIGSAIFATIILGVLSPWFGKIEWVKDNFDRGASLVK